MGFFKNAYRNIRKPTLTDELLKVNSALKLIFSVIEDQCSGGQYWRPYARGRQKGEDGKS